MKLDGGIPTAPGQARAAAQALEAEGYSGGFTAELAHDPFLPLAFAAESTERIELGTGIAVAFARNPMTLANTAHDLQLMSNGRFVLGLGSQIKPHITKRFSMDWSSPAARMREFVLALQAIWANWNTGEPLQFRGEFYKHVLMTPMFTPPKSEAGPPKVFLAGVGPLMTKVAGEVADGFVSHAFQTPSYFDEVTLPALEAGLAEGGRTRDQLEITIPLFSAFGDTDEEIHHASKGTRQQLAFYASTPAYRPVLDHHGWGDIQTELNVMSKAGKWVEMADLITDEILDEFAYRGPIEGFPDALRTRYGSNLDRLQFYSGRDGDQDRWAPVIDQIKAL